MDQGSDPTVLVAEDEPALADLYTAWLEGDYRVRTAYNGSQALDAIDADVDVVLLDRRMPGLSGDRVLSTIRERKLDCRIAMVTAVEPDFDIVEMGFDDYLVKPASKSDLQALVDQLLLRTEYDDMLQEFYALASKRAILDKQKPEYERRASEEYQRLEDRLAVLRTDIDETMAELSDRDASERACRDIA